ncbi:MAG: FAD:protein FMN transferase [Woeseiaceae bacterium]|nr:FAD:protein FMN transferase [Woeseiaceae bacterium]
MLRTYRNVRVIAVAGLVALLASCGSERVAHELSGSTMGTSFNIQVISPPDTLDMDALKVDVAATLAGIEQSMSTYLPDSEVSRFNALTTSAWLDVSASFCRVIADAQAVSKMSGGAFDVTVGALVDLWGFGSGQPISEPPDTERIAALLSATGYEKLHADCSRPALSKDTAELHVDLSAYAKGYGVDQVASLLDQSGIADYLVEIGGEVRVRGKNAKDARWAIAVESPHRDSSKVARIISLSNAAMATSGDYRIYFESAGRFYSHTIDPRTGYPVSHNAAAVTVVADSSAFADGMATALLVLGPVDGLKLAERENIAALFQLRVDDAIDERMSSRFAQEVLAE